MLGVISCNLLLLDVSTPTRNSTAITLCLSTKFSCPYLIVTVSVAAKHTHTVSSCLNARSCWPIPTPPLPGIMYLIMHHVFHHVSQAVLKELPFGWTLVKNAHTHLDILSLSKLHIFLLCLSALLQRLPLCFKQKHKQHMRFSSK